MWRQPALPVGIVLLVLGAGNWLVSRGKVLEYTQRTTAGKAVERVGRLAAFEHLTPRTNAALLERLHRGLGNYSYTAAKRDFYALTRRGGRLFSVIGLLFVGAALLQRWRERRVRRLPAGAASPGGKTGGPERRGK